MPDDEVAVCGAPADSSTPEWAHGTVTCERPRNGPGGKHRGPHSARATPPTGGKPQTLTWVSGVSDTRSPSAPAPDPTAATPSPSEPAAPAGLDGAFRDLLIDALASGNAAIEARVLGHQQGDEFVVDEVLELVGVRFAKGS